MAKKETKALGKNDRIFEILETLLEQQKSAGFDREIKLDSNKSDETDEIAAIVWGQHQGIETARIFVLILPEGNWDRANANYVQEKSYTLPAADTPEDEYPQFAIVTDGQNKMMFDLGYPPYEIDRLPSIDLINDYKRIKADPTYRWSMKMYDRLMRGFDEFHEQVYQNVRDNVSSSNDIVKEVTKILFL